MGNSIVNKIFDRLSMVLTMTGCDQHNRFDTSQHSDCDVAVWEKRAVRVQNNTDKPTLIAVLETPKDESVRACVKKQLAELSKKQESANVDNLCGVPAQVTVVGPKATLSSITVSEKRAEETQYADWSPSAPQSGMFVWARDGQANDRTMDIPVSQAIEWHGNHRNSAESCFESPGLQSGQYPASFEVTTHAPKEKEDLPTFSVDF